MDSKLLVRAYNVGFGDCIYVRIPSKKGGFHILIDCGTLGNINLLERAVEHLKSELPPGDIPGKKRLDLIVATHRHIDHIKGFEASWFKDIQVRNIWISAGMDPSHPQAQKTRRLRALAQQSMQAMLTSRQPASGDIETLASLYSATNEEAEKLLIEKLPELNNIKPKFVHSGMKPAELKPKDLPSKTSIEVLAPERDIDGFYLGKDTDELLKHFDLKTSLGFPIPSVETRTGKTKHKGLVPKNISLGDFEKLRSRMAFKGLEFARTESAIQNNLSVVLMITWRRRRLLFVGDAEWNGEFKEGKRNGSWNVMWHSHGAKQLSKPIDFLKVGHHGSANSTPWVQDESKRKKSQETNGIAALIETLLPIPKQAKPTATAIVSTQRSREPTVPDGRLMMELGKRIGSVRNYDEQMRKRKVEPNSIWEPSRSTPRNVYREHERPYLSSPQPLRTDLEGHLIPGSELYTQIELEPGD